ncbi:MAG: antibiotic biosynthesis monooxygenase [Alphaproteobacteria bacterium]|nr:MAG: antibiotic biosynthesis monooxygenase [Alphaproteobacteria bacterium]
MIGVVAKLPAQEGKGAELKKVMESLAEQVRANESGCLQYDIMQASDNDDMIFVIEKYADQDALKAHGASDHFKAAQPAIGAVIGGKPDIQYLKG